MGSQRKLSQYQKEILLGLILGDGTLEKNGKNVRLRVEHGIKQKDYLWWKYEKLKEFTKSPPRMVKVRDKRTGKENIKWHFSTVCLPELNEYREKFYKKDRKKVPKDIEKYLVSPLSLAVWFMDDGYKRNDCQAFRFNTDCFPLSDQYLLRKCLKRNFNLSVRIHKKNNAWNLYIPASESEKLVKLVKPYLHASFSYKISLAP